MNTEFLNDINWIAVFLGGLGYFFVGAIWYSFLFKNAWIKHSGVDVNDPNMKTGVAAIMISSLILMLITALGLAILKERLDTYGWMGGIKTGLFTGLFFGATAISISYLYEKRPMALHLINGGYTVIGNIVAALIIFSWK